MSTDPAEPAGSRPTLVAIARRASVSLTAGRRDQLRARGIPFTVVDPVGDPPADVPVVGATNTAGGAAATRHLLDLGHTRIAAVAGPLDMACAVDRLAGHREALAAAGPEARPTATTPVPAATSSGGGYLDPGTESLHNIALATTGHGESMTPYLSKPSTGLEKALDFARHAVLP